MTTTPNQDANRRSFLKNSGAAVVAGSVAATFAGARNVHAAGSDILKVGLIGCGGRGSGAAMNAMNAEPNVRLVAMADAFDDRLTYARNILKRKIGERYLVDDDHAFSGFDAYKQLLATDVDVVLLCTPPHFRPMQLKAAVEAGKHVFCEKPVAVDPAGVRSVLESVEQARNKNLALVSGLCWRYDYGVRATMEKILEEKAIGDIVSIQENYLTGTLWHRGRKPEWSEMEYQMRNWLYFTWLSGDHITEQHIHSLDKAVWLMGDKPPARAYGLGGRQVRSEEQWGHVYDHFAVCYEWENGTKCFSYTRQQKGCHNNVEDYIIGTKGTAKVLAHQVTPNEGEAWKYSGKKSSMYDIEHKELFASIRAGKPINNGVYMSYSTMMAIMGREACYSGKVIEFDAAIKSDLDLSPKSYEWGDIEIPKVAQPGQYKFA
jgi:myo-inositol 2-dehydrogenase/D-chiro-inositol 1-dehydrogenase